MDDTYVITIQGSFSHPRKGRVYVNGQRVCVFAFSHGVLSWSKQEHLSVHGLLRLDISSQGKRRLTGSIWKEHTPTSIPQIAFAQEAALESCPKYPLIGVYTRGQEERLSLSPPQLDSPTRKIHVTLNQEQIEEEIRYQGNPPVLSIGLHRFVLTSLLQASEQWSLEKNLSPYFYGSYVVKIESQLFTITVQKEGIWFEETSLKLTGQGHKSIEWTKGPDRYPKGSMAFFLDPMTLVPCCSGTLQSDLGNVVFVHGMVPAYPESSAKSIALALFNIPQPLWMRVLKQSQEESRQGGSFLWTNWCKVHRTINLLHALFKKL